MSNRQDIVDRLAAWLAEWQLEQLLRASETERTRVAPVTAPVSVPDDRNAEPGQVRLMSPCTYRSANAPQYLSVLKEIRPGLLMALFSRFATPATPGELSLSGTADGLAVLSVWNACIVPASRLNRLTWFVENLPEDDLLAAWRVWQSICDNTLPPNDLQHRVGPPIVHPEDPRHDYLAEEELRLDDIRRGTADASPSAALQFVPWQDQCTAVRDRLAAEDEQLYAARAGWRVVATGCLIRLTQESTQSPCLMSVHEPDGQSSARLDGGSVLCRLESVPILSGAAQLPPGAVVDGFLLLDRDDEPLLLERS